MEKKLIRVNGNDVFVPSYYQQVDSMPDDPAGSIPLMVQTDNTTCFIMVFPVDYSKSLPREKEDLIRGIREYLADNQGLIQVETEADYGC